MFDAGSASECKRRLGTNAKTVLKYVWKAGSRSYRCANQTRRALRKCAWCERVFPWRSKKEKGEHMARTLPAAQDLLELKARPDYFP